MRAALLALSQLLPLPSVVSAQSEAELRDREARLRTALEGRRVVRARGGKAAGDGAHLRARAESRRRDVRGRGARTLHHLVTLIA